MIQLEHREKFKDALLLTLVMRFGLNRVNLAQASAGFLTIRHLSWNSRPCVLVLFMFFYFYFLFILFYFVLSFKFIYMQLACDESPLFSHQINIKPGFPQGIQAYWYQNRANYTKLIIYASSLRIQLSRSISQEQKQKYFYLEIPT